MSKKIDLDFVLSEKGAKSKPMMVSELTVKLSWHANVDLDLMAFYKTKDGDVGGVYSSLYSENGQGSLTQFPYMELSGDAGVGDQTNEKKVEHLTIKKFDHISELYLVAINFTDASRNKVSTFSQFDGRVEISNEKGQTYTVVLASQEKGSTAVFARIERTNDLIGAVLINESIISDFKTFRTQVPGADRLSLANKLLLQGKGDRAQLQIIQGDVRARLRWKSSVDLDLHCFYTAKASAAPKKSRGFFARLLGGGGEEATSGHIYFSNRGDIRKSPFIHLDQDAGVGDQGGDNEENIQFGDISKIDQAIIAANIFNKPNARFSTYDGSVIIKAGSQEIEIPLTESKPGAWCIIAQIDNRTGTPSIVNINQTQTNRPTSADV